MNMGIKIVLLHWIGIGLIGCASTPKPVAKKKVGTTAPAAATAAKTVKGTVPGKAAPAKAPVKAVKAPPPAPAEEEEVAAEEEEEDDQFSRIKKYYKK